MNDHEYPSKDAVTHADDHAIYQCGQRFDYREYGVYRHELMKKPDQRELAGQLEYMAKLMRSRKTWAQEVNAVHGVTIACDFEAAAVYLEKAKKALEQS